MSSPEAPPSANSPLWPYVSQIDEISIEEVVGETRLGSGLSFRGAESPLRSIKEFAEHLHLLDCTGMPTRMLGKCTSALQEVLSTIQQMRIFNPANYAGNPNMRNSFVQQLNDGYEKLAEAAVPVLLYSELRSSGIKSAQARAYDLLAEIEKQRNELTGAVNESKELLAGQKKFSAEIAIAGYGTLFAKEAKEHGDAAKRWLVVTSVLAALTSLAAVANYRTSISLLNEFASTSASHVPNLPASLTVQFTIAKVILFTIGLSAAYWSARVYRSHRHNSIVNKHRANALTSFQEFVISTTDPEVKNAVLLQTTSCIYAPQPTGFSSGNDTDGDSPLKILEIVRNFQK